MVKQIRVTKEAKQAAYEGLNSDSGLSQTEAKKLGIRSGRETAKQILRSEKIPIKDARRIAAFYQRFKNCKTKRCENAIKLWGGRNFGRNVVTHVKKGKKK